MTSKDRKKTDTEPHKIKLEIEKLNAQKMSLSERRQTTCNKYFTNTTAIPTYPFHGYQPHYNSL